MARVSFIEKNGGRRLLLIPGGTGEDIHVLPGTHEMPDAQWDRVKRHKGAAGYIARGELFETEPERKPTPTAMNETGHDSNDILDAVKEISRLSVEDAIAALNECDVKEVFVALLAKDNREAIRQYCEKRIKGMAEAVPLADTDGANPS